MSLQPRVTKETAAATPPRIGFAHRGAPLRRSEHNTLAAFERALALGAGGLESDIALTADGVAVLCHPRTPLHRGPDVSRLLHRDLPAGIPSLADLYDRCGAGFNLSLDMAQPGAADQVVRVAASHGAAHRLWLTYWRLPTLEQWRAQWPRQPLVFPTLPLGGRRAVQIMDRLAGIGVDAINVHHLVCTRRLVAAGHARGLRVFAWGLRRERSIERVLTAGADAVYCDDVAAMVAALGRYGAAY